VVLLGTEICFVDEGIALVAAVVPIVVLAQLLLVVDGNEVFAITLLQHAKPRRVLLHVGVVDSVQKGAIYFVPHFYNKHVPESLGSRQLFHAVIIGTQNVLQVLVATFENALAHIVLANAQPLTQFAALLLLVVLV